MDASLAATVEAVPVSAAFLIKFHDGTFFRSPPKADPEVASDEEENAPELDLAPSGSFKRLRNASQIMVPS